MMYSFDKMREIWSDISEKAEFDVEVLTHPNEYGDDELAYYAAELERYKLVLEFIKLQRTYLD